MPRPGDIDTTYLDKLRDIEIDLLESFQGAKVHHRMQCRLCSYVWYATPISKLQNYKKHGVKGCPRCTTNAKYEVQRSLNVNRLKQRGLTIIGEWDGTSGSGKDSTPLNVTVRNTNCGHTFTASSKNLLARGVTCPVCAREYKNSVLVDSSKTRSEEWQKTASDWKLYKSTVAKLTRLSYNKHKDQINPTNLPTGRAGTPGAYHLDHIVPIRYCYDNNIPEDVCAHHTNLQMLGWRENVGSRDNLKEGYEVPAILSSYVK